VGTLVWIVGGIFLVNVLALGWLATLALVERRRLNKEIKQVDALWRYLTTPLSATVSWGARGRVGGKLRQAAIHPAPAGSAGKSWLGLAVAATVIWVAAVAFHPADQGTITSARGVGTSFVSPELEVRRTGESSAPGVKVDGARLSPQAQASSNAPSTSIATSTGETVPATVAAQPHSSTAIVIEWDEVPLATGYAVERKKEAVKQGWLRIAKVGEAQTTYKDGHLDAATTYFYRVSAMTDDGAAPPSDVVSATTPIAVPPATDVTAVATLDTITLSWTDVTDETGYRVERSLDGATEWIEIATTGQDVTTYVNATLSPRTTYFYRIVATNAGGDSTPSNVAFATTEKPRSDNGGIAPITESPAAGGALAVDTPAAGGTQTVDTQVVDGLLAPQTEKPLEGSASVEGDPVAVEGIEGTAPTA
jgi:fibronectin type 3 domain-containing protein